MKSLTMLLLGGLALSLAACDQRTDTAATDTQTPPPADTAAPPTSTPGTPADTTGTTGTTAETDIRDETMTDPQRRCDALTGAEREECLRNAAAQGEQTPTQDPAEQQ